MTAIHPPTHDPPADRIASSSVGRVLQAPRAPRDHATPLECPRCGARWHYSVAPDVVRFGDVELDLASRTVRRGDGWLVIAPRVLDLLVALVERAPRVVTRGELLREVWGYEADTVTRTVDTHVRMLRRAIEPDPGRPRFVRTVLKVGYRFTF